MYDLQVRSYVGTWKQTALNRAHNDSWRSPTRIGYARLLAASKMWVSTTGPEGLVGTRYFEVLASGTTLLLCNRPPSPHIYSGLFEEDRPSHPP